MANLRYEAGRRAEWELKKQYEAAGYLVIRSAGSKSAFDLVAIDIQLTDPVLLIQVKRAGTENIADRLIDKFIKDPPLKVDMGRYIQMMQVRVPRVGWISGCA
jgi:hypothetical protein